MQRGIIVIKSFAKSINKPTSRAATNNTISHLRVLLKLIGGRRWRKKNKKNLVVKVRLALWGLTHNLPPYYQSTNIEQAISYRLLSYLLSSENGHF